MATQIALDATGSKLNFDSNTLVIDESNNRVGVGTGSPSYDLHVSNPSTNVNFKLQAGGGSSRFYLDAKGGGEFGEIHFMHDGAKKACIWHHKDSILHFKTGSGGPSGTGHLSIDASGNIGIGNSSPTTKLQVNGSFSIEIGYNKTIDSGAIEIDHSVHAIIPESGTTDDLVNINIVGGGTPADGQIIVLRLTSDANTITLKHDTGNLLMGGDKVLTSAEDSIMLMYWSSHWNLISHSVNG